ncbi:MAG TPA: inositol monophosphatase [Acidimicrobiales bacterium]|nr:inositol monophosphatase [Acidimicrobiales bacterium]
MTDRVLEVLLDAATAVAGSLAHNQRWGLTGAGDHQYVHDTVADEAAIAVLERAGLGVFSEESGLHGAGKEVLVVIDPVDGSTNASRGLPFWAVSLCALDGAGPMCSVVTCPPAGQCYTAVRGGGARLDGQVLRASGETQVTSSVVAFNGYPDHHYGWAQYRAFGAAALELCAVASGAVDAFVDASPRGLAPWDYLGAMLVCLEAGAVVHEVGGRELVLRRPGERRSLVAAGTGQLAGALLAHRRGEA